MPHSTLKTIRWISATPFVITILIAVAGALVGIDSGLIGAYTVYYGWEAFMWILLAAVFTCWWLYLVAIGALIITTVLLWKEKRRKK